MRKLIKIILFLLVLLAIVYGSQIFFRERKLIILENKAGTEFKNERYKEAIDIYEEMLALIGRENIDNERLDQVRRKIAECYKNLAESPETPLYRSIEFYRQALYYDESSVKDETINRLLDAENLILPGRP